MIYEGSPNDLEALLLNGTIEEIEGFIENIHPADILDLLHHFEGNQLDLLSKLPEWMIANVIEEAEDDQKYELLSIFSDSQQIDIVEEMASDEIADMLGSIEPEDADKLLDKMDPEDAEDVRELLSYPPDTAGGIMATEFISVKETMTVKEILKYLQKEAPGAETAYYIYVVNDVLQLKGVVSLRDIVTSTFDTLILDIMSTNMISVPVDMDQEEVGHYFEKYGFLTMPVVDEADRMIGIVTVDDIMQILRNENTEDIYRLAGIQEDEKISGSLWSSIKSRLPWLFVNLLTAFLASSIIGLFQGTIGKVVILAAFMPIVSGMGGNAGTQTLTIIVRGIALGEVGIENSKKILLREIGVGLTAGASIGTCVALIGYFWIGKPVLGLVIGMAMLLNMTFATVAGFSVPIILKKLKIDPALASAVFVTTVTDVLGFLFFLGLATIFINYLV